MTSMRLRACALATLGLFLLAAPSGADAQRRRRVQAPSEGSIVIQSEVQGAEVIVDERPVGTTPLDPIAVAPGSHTIRVRMPGYTEYTDVVQVQAGRATDVAVELLPLSHVLSVTTEPAGAHVFVDGTFMGETPVEFDVLEGTHALRLVLHGYEEVVRQVEARAGTRSALHFDLVAQPGAGPATGPRLAQWYEEPVTWVAVGGGAVAIALVVSIVAVAASSSSGSQIDAFCAEGCIRHVPAW